MTTVRWKLPDGASTGPLHPLMLRLGLDRDNPRDVLPAAVYRLAARLERQTPPWDAAVTGLIRSSIEVRLSAGRCGVRLGARVGSYADLFGGTR